MALDTAASLNGKIPQTATYRFQFNKDFTFADAERLIPHLKNLGVSHVYCSPIAQAVSGSTHGYDCTDPNTLNPELGSRNDTQSAEEDFTSLMNVLQNNGMGAVLDIVPNHMGIKNGENALWQRMLREGPDFAPADGSIKAADFFDIDWDKHLDGKIVLPVLGQSSGSLINDRSNRWGGTMPQLAIVENNGTYELDYWDNRFPINAQGTAIIEEALNKDSLVAINQDAGLFRKVLDAQHYRIEDWQSALEGNNELNYRRFFTENSLAGVRVEDPIIFAALHEGIKEWVQHPAVTGVRCDHIDGLVDPTNYLRNLRNLVGEDTDIYIENILAPEETLPAAWKETDINVAGTTGYDWMSATTGLLTSQKGFDNIEAYYKEMVDDQRSFDEILHESARMIIESELKPELNNIQHYFATLLNTQTSPYHTSSEDVDIRLAVKEMLVAMEQYRIYPEVNKVASDQDAEILRKIADNVKSDQQDIAPVVDAIVEVFTNEEKLTKLQDNPQLRDLRSKVVSRMMQLAGPAEAVSKENTAFFRDIALLCAREVGSDPTDIARNAESFTQLMQTRDPREMNALATHDTKLGEDTRARSLALSHIGGAWETAVSEWQKANQDKLTDSPLTAKDQYRVYQTLVASYPLELLFAENNADIAFQKNEYIERLTRDNEQGQGYLIKAIREAKENTSWIPQLPGSTMQEQNSAYEQAMTDFVTALIHDNDFINDKLKPFTQKVARMGANVSLTQKALQLLTPGVPDIYQGREHFSYDLADPDNRTQVDYENADQTLNKAGNESRETLSENWQNSGIKSVLTQKLLQLRQTMPELFASNESATDDKTAEFTRLTIYDSKNNEVDGLYAFARQHKDEAVIAVVPTDFSESLFVDKGNVCELDNNKLSNYHIEIPEALWGKNFHNVLENNDMLSQEMTGMPATITLAGHMQHAPLMVLATQQVNR